MSIEFLGNMAFGGGVVAAYAAYRFLSSKTDEERAHYDWMGYIAMSLGVAFLIPLPFAGYWLMREVYAYQAANGYHSHGWIVSLVVYYSSDNDRNSLFLTTNYYSVASPR